MLQQPVCKQCIRADICRSYDNVPYSSTSTVNNNIIQKQENCCIVLFRNVVLFVVNLSVAQVHSTAWRTYVAVVMIMMDGLQSLAAEAGHMMMFCHTSSSLRATPIRNFLNQVWLLKLLWWKLEALREFKPLRRIFMFYSCLSIGIAIVLANKKSCKTMCPDHY